MSLASRARTAAVSITALAAAGALAAAALSAPAHAAPPSYVALGDSYSSGTGTRSYINDGSNCLRSAFAYPSLIASARGYALNFRACSGAEISDVEAVQLSALSSSTRYVTISIGGNDAGFADVLTECAQPAWVSDCYGAIAGAREVIDNRLPNRLASLYSQIRSRAPRAEIVAVGYPRIFNGEDCNLATFFSRTEMSRLNTTADVLNERTRTVARNAGLRFANPTQRFVGHAVCDDQEWINGLSWPIVESFHPNRAGHASGYTPTVSGTLGRSVRVTGDVRAEARATAPSLAAQQRGYAARDARIEPKTVLAPDLSSPRVKAAAKRAGVDLSSRASIEQTDRRVSRLEATTLSDR